MQHQASEVNKNNYYIAVVGRRRPTKHNGNNITYYDVELFTNKFYLENIQIIVKHSNLFCVRNIFLSK